MRPDTAKWPKKQQSDLLSSGGSQRCKWLCYGSPACGSQSGPGRRSHKSKDKDQEERTPFSHRGRHDTCGSRENCRLYLAEAKAAERKVTFTKIMLTSTRIRPGVDRLLTETDRRALLLFPQEAQPGRSTCLACPRIFLTPEQSSRWGPSSYPVRTARRKEAARPRASSVRKPEGLHRTKPAVATASVSRGQHVVPVGIQ